MTIKIDKKKIITVITAVLCIVVFTILLFYVRAPHLFTSANDGVTVNFDDDFIKFMDVGQGDGAIIYSNGYCAVIDMGEAIASNDVLADLSRLNVKQIDMLIVSHYHSDHIGGFSDVSKKYKIKNMVGPKLVESNSLAGKSAKEKVIKQGGKFYEGIFGLNFNVGEFKITLLGYCDSDNENDRSIYLMAEIDGVKFLFTGDGETLAEKELLKRTKDIDCDILKVAHHGSKKSSGFTEKKKKSSFSFSSYLGNSKDL